jgi:ABC-type bacteriocin/lantibiotic exporter with double-glycine peptidase domain
MLKSVRKLIVLISPRTRKFIPVVVFSIFFIGVLEMLTIVLLLPLITSTQMNMTGAVDSQISEVSKGISLVYKFYEKIGITTIPQMAVFIIMFMLFKHLCITALNYVQFKLIFSNDIWLRNKLVDSYLSDQYSNFSKLKSSEIIRNTAEQVGQISYGSLLSLLTILSEGIVVLILLLLIINSIPLFSSLFIILVFIIGFLPFYIFKKKMIILGAIRFQSISKTIAEIQSIYNLYIEIKLYRLKEYFLNRIKEQSTIFSNAQIQNSVIANIPKSFVEIAAVIIILLLVIGTNDSGEFLSTIGIVITSIFRITPSFTRISSALNQYKFSIEQINVLSEILKSNSKKTELNEGVNFNNIKFENNIRISNISFGYDNDKLLFEKFSMTIQKGDFIIIKGKSGTGKSTLVKIIMGLLKPQEGVVEIDGFDLESFGNELWTKKIAFVPQKPVIIHGTLLENICLGCGDEEIDNSLYKRIIFDTQLSELDDDLNGGVLLEDGGSISGGQSQRIGIARALYRKPSLIFLDEPTSALDHKNSDSIISLLSKFNKEEKCTIVIISHSNEYDVYSSQIINI